MHDGHQQFLHYILECVSEEHVEYAQTLVLENFKKQNEQSFTHEDLVCFNNIIIKLIKPERKEEVCAVLNQFGEMHIS